MTPRPRALQKAAAPSQAASSATSGTQTPAKPRPRGKKPLSPQIRVIGTPEEVAGIISRLNHVVTVTARSRQIPRRDEPGRVAVHLEIRPED